MRLSWMFAACVWLAASGMTLAEVPPKVEFPPFIVADNPEREAIQRRVEVMDAQAFRRDPTAAVANYRSLYRAALKAYGPDAIEPYAVLDRLAVYHASRGQVSESKFNLTSQPAEAARESRKLMQETCREVIRSLGKSKVADWWKRGVIAKHEGMIQQAEGRIDEARKSFEAADKALSTNPYVTSYELVYILLAEIKIAAKQGRWDDAEAACDRVFRVVREKSARSFESVMIETLDSAEGLAAYHLAYSIARRRANLPGRAARFAEWNLNAKVYRREVFARRLDDLKDAKSGREAEVWKALRQRWQLAALLSIQPAILSGPPQQIESMRRGQAGAVKKALDESRLLSQEAGQIASKRARAADEWLSIDKVRAALPPDTVLIDLVSHPDYDFDAPADVTRWNDAREIAFIIPPAGKGEVRLIDLGGEDGIWRVIDAYVRAVRMPPSDDAGTLRATGAIASKATRDLSRALLHPLLPHIKDSRRWIISPQALTWLVPWSTLVEPDGTPVVERHATSYVSAGRHVARPLRTRPAGTKSGAPLIIAAPDYGPNLLGKPDIPFAPLPTTADEANAIAPHLKSYAGVTPRVLLGPQASEAALYPTPSPSVLVASTHGYYGRLPDTLVGMNLPMLRCGLAFVGANRRQSNPDGVATGLEILSADFRGTDLVVLSACETSYGEVQATQGMIGLNLAFHLAGARTVLGALWPVPVDETTELTTAFFDELGRGTPSDEALRRSQAALLKRLRQKPGGAHPAFWAGFVLSGETLTRPAAPPR